jgi:hypothetical protein
MSQHGRISGRWPAEELNKVGADLIELLGGNIPMEAEYKAGKEVRIQLTKAVALENNRGSIAAAQKTGRATKITGLGSGPGSGPGSRSESGSDTELANALATAQNAVSAAANALASSPPVVSQLNQQTATPLDQVDTQNPSPLRPRPRRQLFTQSQSSPIRQPQSRVSPDLPAPAPAPAPALAPVKKTRKPTALMEDHREVDMGPRKLRNRK